MATQTGKIGVRIFNGLAPAELPKALPHSFDFSAVSSIHFDLRKARDEAKIAWVQTVYIDNSANAQPISVKSAITNQTVTCPPNCQGYFPVLAAEPDFILSTTGGVVVLLQFINVMMPASVWNASSFGGGGGGGGSVNLGFRQTVAAADNASAADINGVIAFNNGATPGAQTENLNMTFTTKGQFVVVVDEALSSGANAITVHAPPGLTINGAATDVINNNGDARWYTYDGVTNLVSM